MLNIRPLSHGPFPQPTNGFENNDYPLFMYSKLHFIDFIDYKESI